MKKLELGSIATVISGQHILQSDHNQVGSGIGYLTGPADFGPIQPTITRWTNKPKVLCLPGDILITVKGAGVGKINLAPNETVAIGRQLMAIRAGRSLVDKDYLLSFLLTCIGHFQKKAVGATIPGLARDDLETLLIPIPSIRLQQKIAADLKAKHIALDEARKAASEQLDSIRILKTEAFNAVFSELDYHVPIGKYAHVQSGYAFKSESFKASGIRLLRNANILPGRVYWDDAAFIDSSRAYDHAGYQLHEGNVLISLDRPLISSGLKVARVAASDVPSLLVQRVGRFVIDRSHLHPDYLYAFLQTSSFIDAISGHGQSLGVPHISPGQIEAIEIPLPDMHEQERLAVKLTEIASAVDAAQDAALAQLKDLDVLPGRLLAQAFDFEKEADNG